MNNVLETEAFLDRFVFYIVVLDKGKLILRRKEKGRKRLKGGETCTYFLAESLFLASNEKNNARQICSLPGIYCNRACTIIIFQTPTIRRRD